MFEGKLIHVKIQSSTTASVWFNLQSSNFG
jgi:hypothetical protein